MARGPGGQRIEQQPHLRGVRRGEPCGNFLGVAKETRGLVELGGRDNAPGRVDSLGVFLDRNADDRREALGRRILRYLSARGAERRNGESTVENGSQKHIQVKYSD